MTVDQALWLISRTAALTAFFILAGALLTGQALRTALLEGMIRSRDLAALHRFLTVCWLPLVVVHVVTIVLDQVSRLSWLDALVPFRSPYAAIPIGLGTVGFDLLVMVTVTSYLRRQLSPALWRWLHRMTYVMFGVFFFHALLAGSDFARPVIAAAAWATVVFMGILSLARLVVGRLDTGA